MEGRAQGDAGRGATGPAGVNDEVEGTTVGEARVELLADLFHGRDVAQGAEAVGAAFRDEVGAPTEALEAPGFGGHQRLALPVLGGRDEGDLGPQELHQQRVAVEREGGGWILRAQEDAAPEAEARGEGGGGAAVVGLEGAAGHHQVSAPRQGVREEVLELADLVARLDAAARVVALDPEIDAETLGQPREPLQRRRRVRQS